MKVSSKVIGWEFCLWCSLWLFSGRRKTKTECRDLDWLSSMAVKAKEACLAKQQEFHLWHLDKHTVVLNTSIRRHTIQMKLCMLTSTSKCGVGRVLVLQFSAWRCWNYFLTMQWILWKIIQFQCFKFDHHVFVPVLIDDDDGAYGGRVSGSSGSALSSGNGNRYILAKPINAGIWK